MCYNLTRNRKAEGKGNLMGKGESMEDMGMTNEQYKGMLLDELEDWQEVLEYLDNDEPEKAKKRHRKY